jgi:hypothetical protein
MRTAQEVYARLQQRLLHECRNIVSKGQEMGELAAPYHRYVDLEDQVSSSRRRMSYIVGLFGPDRIEQTMKIDDTTCLRKILGLHPSPRELRKKLRLWRAVREYLRIAGKSTVTEIQVFLDWLGLERITRQAIESALKRHEDTFKVTKSGHNRYVELKRETR